MDCKFDLELKALLASVRREINPDTLRTLHKLSDQSLTINFGEPKHQTFQNPKLPIFKKCLLEFNKAK
ncbi:hypothetical protein A3740_20030 [Oleiphilus sp. HI0068]|nr:hypothetical protein A3732_14785 [Oleiphilus sp. HI0050]KZY72884.1 hypothetical protein A3740_20030 [Oleiphilus sp. HI0068]KZY78590.1 hypothetical protein A3741_08405 [Oleiphilus sp. HI0069]KZZ33921.1 hypothetical protein A3757_00420 [Oleiphilus sp. HI0117]KZZ39261.1 hypothetical protein A3756_08705 [Oleiphilus sp. HI0086]KZZ46865.1 hypothetical protein A3755_17375 [Oleiphilus sp. HI0085]KZZ61067.1 hypothetical protein A3761_04700 [Oleiphilus sp. HI0123]KZZ75034.1 hypothetical protein A37